jgi:hypothetical protein
MLVAYIWGPFTADEARREGFYHSAGSTDFREYQCAYEIKMKLKGFI